MKIEIPDTASLPEWAHKFVAEGQLDFAAIPEPENVDGLKSALGKERVTVSAYSKLGTPEEIAAKIADLTEKAKGSGKGAEEMQAKIEALEQKYKTENTELREREAQLYRRNALSELKSELAKNGVIADAIDDIATVALSRVEYMQDGTPKVPKRQDGTDWIETGGPDLNANLAQLAKELAVSKPYAVRDLSIGGGGKPPAPNGGKPSKSFSEMTSGELVALKRSNPTEYDRLKAAS
jgi:hypothetical protein